MLHVATVHWMSDQWINIQRKYFDQFAGGPFKMHAFVNGIEKDYSHLFDFYSTENIQCCTAGYNHGIKLNILADAIASQADDDDVMVFIDGDAFPIADLTAYITEHLQQFPLLAVKRQENLTDEQPHPCFAATKVKTWKAIKGDWCPGYRWTDAAGRYVTDTGGNLLGRLLATETPWQPVLRSNKKDLHPLWFGVYGDVVYHHGAGFRGKIERIDRADIDREFGFRTRIKQWQNNNNWTVKNIGYLLNSLYNHRAYDREVEHIKNRNLDMMAKVFSELENDTEFWRQFV